MDAISALTAEPPSANAATSIGELGSSDFLRLMIAELTNQDPLEPTGNKELLQQISSIRDIELSTSLTSSLEALTGQQRFTSASSMIGKYVTGVAGTDGRPVEGLVTSVRFAPQGDPILVLSSGEEIRVDQLTGVQSADLAAESMIGRSVLGLDRTDPKDPQVVDGQVTSVNVGENGQIDLELDGGDSVELRDVITTRSGTK